MWYFYFLKRHLWTIVFFWVQPEMDEKAAEELMFERGHNEFTSGRCPHVLVLFPITSEQFRYLIPKKCVESAEKRHLQVWKKTSQSALSVPRVLSYQKLPDSTWRRRLMNRDKQVMKGGRKRWTNGTTCGVVGPYKLLQLFDLWTIYVFFFLGLWGVLSIFLGSFSIDAPKTHLFVQVPRTQWAAGGIGTTAASQPGFDQHLLFSAFFLDSKQRRTNNTRVRFFCPKNASAVPIIFLLGSFFFFFSIEEPYFCPDRVICLRWCSWLDGIIPAAAASSQSLGGRLVWFESQPWNTWLQDIASIHS